ncbi:MAG: hypothetical protein K0R76_569 [Alphaproteobacteria bacterium]|jgi:hypothetical protein|nr:hypothetical protein [Alphaproteobacteria bacterium]MDF3033615.1 hypothetical protein [Alphaproteobacteria bacterium]
MDTLYKNVQGKLNFWEAWNKDDNTAIVHWGVVGERGKTKEVRSTFLSSHTKKIKKEREEQLQDGYKKISIDEQEVLLIEYKVDGMGTPEDISKRHALQNKMQETLGWTGLGHCDGGSIGSGTMEVCCYVVSFELAKRAIEKDLKDSEFSDYSRIYNEAFE